MYAGDELYGDDITSGVYEGELEQADFEHELEDLEDGLDYGDGDYWS